jgi:methylase of polypeptide subunit release factors
MRVNLGDKKDIATIKRETIQNSIYGVDIEPSAVEIAKLRFWLSIVVDEVTPTPLPNLAYKIMVGNSLLQTLNGFDPLVQNQNKKAQKEIRQLQSKFHDYFNEFDVKKKEKIDAEVKENINLIFQKTLKNFDIQPRLEMDKKEQKQYENDVENHMFISKIMKEYIKDNYTTELFFYKIYFREVVVDNKGFDVVIGNPPYVRHEKIKELKLKLKVEGYKSYSGTADLYIYFFEQGYNLLKENGVLSYITSNKYTRAKYGKQFREFVLKNATILEYIDFNGVKVFESATVDTSILSYKKSNSKKSSFIYCDINSKYKKESELEKFVAQNGFEYLQSDLSVDSFSFSSLEELAIKKRIEKIGTPLKEWDIKNYRGIQTGNNSAFIINKSTYQELTYKNKKNLEIIKPIFQGKDIKKYLANFNDKYLIYVNDEIDITKYPLIYNHLLQYKINLEKKIEVKQNKMKWYVLYRPAKKHINEFNKEKIVWQRITQEPTFCFVDKNYYLLDSMAFLISDYNKYLLGFLNSKLLAFYIDKITHQYSSTGYLLSNQFVEQLPIPKIPKKQQKPFEILVDYIIFAKEENLSLEASLFESVIDGMVYDLYFEEEMKRGDCFISDEVNKVIVAFDNSMDRMKEMYKVFKNNKTIQRGIIYKRVIPIVKVINGVDR